MNPGSVFISAFVRRFVLSAIVGAATRFLLKLRDIEKAKETGTLKVTTKRKNKRKKGLYT